MVAERRRVQLYLDPAGVIADGGWDRISSSRDLIKLEWRAAAF